MVRISTAFVKENNNFTLDFTGFLCSWQLFSFPKFEILLKPALAFTPEHSSRPASSYSPHFIKRDFHFFMRRSGNDDIYMHNGRLFPELTFIAFQTGVYRGKFAHHSLVASQGHCL